MNILHYLFILNGQPRPLLPFIFSLIKQISLQILQQINVHPVYGIRTHNVRNMSLLP